MKTFLLSLTFALAAMFSGLALATPGNNGGGNGGCGDAATTEDEIRMTTTEASDPYVRRRMGLAQQ